MIDLDSEIENWRRLVRQNRIFHRCCSAERHYRAPAELLEMDEMPPEPAKMPVRWREGWACELAWRLLPDFKTRMLVSYHYIRNRSLEEAARKAKVPKHKAEFLLAQARAQMRQRLLILLNR